MNVLNIPYILAYKSKNLGQILALKARGSTYTWGNNFAAAAVDVNYNKNITKYYSRRYYLHKACIARNIY